MKRNERRIILGCICTGIMLACCVSGIIALGRDQIGAGAVLMAAMFAMAYLTDGIFKKVRDSEALCEQLRTLRDMTELEDEE